MVKDCELTVITLYRLTVFIFGLTHSHQGGAEKDGHEIAGHENDGPSSRA